MSARPTPPVGRPGANRPQPRAPQTPAGSPTPPAGAPPKKRPGDGIAPLGKRPAAARITVYSTAASDEIGIETLVGEYIEQGTNHGRKAYRRVKARDGVEDVAVFLYYWDTRDGADFSGWWFGDKIGGTQVWSRNEKADPVPPTSGWQIPWDGEVNNDLTVDLSGKTRIDDASALDAESSEPVDDAGAAAQVQDAADRVTLTEIEGTQALENASAMLEGEVSTETLKMVEDLLQTQFSNLKESQQKLAAEVASARRASPKSVTALTNLIPRLRSVQASVVQELEKVKALSKEKKKEAADAQNRAKAEEQQLAAEQRDAKALEAALPDAMDLVGQVEDAFESVLSLANSLNAEADGLNEAAKKTIRDVETSAAKVQQQISEARKNLSQKISTARSFAPEARKVALAEYAALQEKLSDTQKKLAPLTRVRKEFEMKLEAKKVMSEVAGKLGSVEIEVERAIGAAGDDACEADIRKAEGQLAPVLNSLATALKFVDQKVQSATGPLKADLLQMQERGKASKKRLEDFRGKLKSQLEKLQLQSMLAEGLLKTQSAEQSFEKTEVAETPFLKGIDLPTEEASAAIEASEAAAKAAETVANQAQVYLKAKLAEVKHFTEESQKLATDELIQLQNRVEVVVQKVAAFKRDTAQRKTQMLLQEVTTKVLEAEARIEKTVSSAQPLSPEQFEDADAEQLKAATEQVLDMEKAAALAIVAAKKALSQKQKDSQSHDNATLNTELKKMQERITAAQTRLQQQRKLALQGEKSWKSKLLLKTKEAELKRLEHAVEQLNAMATDQASDDVIRDMAERISTLQHDFNETTQDIDRACQGTQGSTKTALVKLQAHCRQLQEKFDGIKTATQEQRERVQVEAILRDAKSRVGKVDDAFKKADKAELPYLKGDDLLPLVEARSAVAECEAATSSIQQAIDDARSFLATKALEIRACVANVSKSGMQEVQALNQKIETSVEKLSQFKQDTDGRKKISQGQEAQARVEAAEQAVQKTILATAPLAGQAADELPPEEAAKIVESLADAEQKAQAKLDDARKYITDRQRESKGAQSVNDNLSALLSRLNSAQIDLAKAKSAASEHEQKFVARMLLQEVNQKTEALEALFEKVTGQAAPLVEHAGKSFVVASMTKMILEALLEYGSKTQMDVSTLFDLAKPQNNQLSEETFCAFLESIPELCTRPDLAFSGEQRKAVFQHLDTNKDGHVTRETFVVAFREKHLCTQGISVTEGFDISDTKTLGKLEVGDVVEAIGMPKSHQSLGVMRLEVKVCKDGSHGWVTLQGNQGTMYFEPHTAFGAFMREISQAISSLQQAGAECTAAISEGFADLKDASPGPLADAKAELTKLRPKVMATLAKVDTLRKKIEEGKKEHIKREEFEKRKALEKKDRQAAAVILGVIEEKVKLAEEVFQKFEECASPLLGQNANPSSHQNPLSVKKQVAEVGEAVESAVVATIDVVKAHISKVAKAQKGPFAEARDTMKKLHSKVTDMKKKVTAAKDSLEDVCAGIVSAKFGEVAVHVRRANQSRGSTLEACFAEIAGQADTAPRDKFESFLGQLSGFAASREQLQLMLDSLGSENVHRRRFFQLLERYCVCVKDVAITESCDVKAAGSLRKLEVGEYIEVTDGPKKDEESGLTRIHGRALRDNAMGWITMRGNQGTPFLQDSPKPSLYATEDIPLQDGFSSEGTAIIRTVKRHEVVEVLEGPRQEEVGSIVRAKVKAMADGKVGWFTLTNKLGESQAQPSTSSWRVVAAIALTDARDIRQCNVLRKLDRDELLTVLEGPTAEGNAGLLRIRVKATKDNAEGWVTTQGNAGSVFAKEAGKQYKMSKPVPLHREFGSESADTLRILEVDELLELLEEPREETSDASTRVRVRVAADGRTGWLSQTDSNLQPWSAQYTCENSIAMQDACEVGTAQLVRMVDVGETVQLLDGPVEDTEVGVMRIKCQAARDGATGWMTISGNQGKTYLKVGNE